jgi:exodeoxyribonuclease VII small subunit
VELQDFEKALQRLEEIVQRLEEGSPSLQESLGLFEEGTQLSKELRAVLSSAQGKVEKLLSDVSGEQEQHEGEPMDQGSPGSDARA